MSGRTGTARPDITHQHTAPCTAPQQTLAQHAAPIQPSRSLCSTRDTCKTPKKTPDGHAMSQGIPASLIALYQAHSWWGWGTHPWTRVGDAAGLGADSGCGEQGGRCRAGRRAPVSAPARRELGWRGASTLPGQAVLWEAGSAAVPPPWALPPAGTGRAEAAPLSGTGCPHGHGLSLLQKGLGDRFLELWGMGWFQVVIFCPE